MAVFRFFAIHRDSDDYDESGSVVARDKLHAFDKLTRLGYTRVNLQKVEGLAGWFQQYTADIR